ncbi:MAG: ABC-2 family transporter protein [bacterium]
MGRITYYIKIWLMMSKNAFLIWFAQTKLLTLFLLGKILRFVFFITFLIFLLKGADKLAGYDANQAIFFFLTFNVIDVLSQFLFREVYRFRPQIVSGDFDLTLAKPMSPLFKSLMGGVDVIDLVIIPPLLIAVFYVGSMLNPNFLHLISYILLLFNGLLIAAAFHIIVLSLGIITLEIDHTIMIYRDLTNLGRLPVDIYKEPLKGILTYFVPIGIMISLPAKALMGIVSLPGVLWSLGFGAIALFLSIKFWNFALTKYTSASS